MDTPTPAPAESRGRGLTAADALQLGGVSQSTFYRGTDPAPNAQEFYGLFNGDGRPKKVADAFSLWRD
ncbi:MAG: hypothetical protein IPP87_05755 [Ideonella sp.]|nr:hypothetical protein [Ideonella sp.]